MSPPPLTGTEAFEALLHAIRFRGDTEPAETREWLDALQDEARRHALGWGPRLGTPYLNTIGLH